MAAIKPPFSQTDFNRILCQLYGNHARLSSKTIEFLEGKCIEVALRIVHNGVSSVLGNYQNVLYLMRETTATLNERGTHLIVPATTFRQRLKLFCNNDECIRASLALEFMLGELFDRAIMQAKLTANIEESGQVLLEPQHIVEAAWNDPALIRFLDLAE